MSVKKLLLLAVMFLGAGRFAAGLELVKNGQPNAVVVTAAGANGLIKRAAEDFVYHVKLLTGAELPVVTNGAGAAEGNVVYIGASEGTRALGIDADSLPREGFRILARGKALAIVGKDKPVITYAPDGGIKRMDDDPFSLYAQPATWYGVAHFFEKYYGVRWFWPGEAGIYYEPRKTLAVEALDETRAPAYILRQMRSLMSGSGLSRFPKEVFRQVNYAPGDVDRMVAEYKVWERRMRLGRGGMIQASHSLGYFYDKYYKDHPEYLAQQLDGTREWPEIFSKKNIKLCVSNPDVARILIENGEKFFEGRKLSNIEDFTYNIGFTDGDGWCWCDQCKALDPQDQVKREYSVARKEGDVWIQKKIEYPFLSDRYVMLWNKVAAALAQKHPGKFVGSLIYGACSAAPVRERVHPNVLLNTTAGSDFRGTNPVGKIARRMDGWFKAGLKNFYWRPNLMYFDHYGLPYTYAWEAGRAMQYLAGQGMKGFDFDTWWNHFGSDGVNVYVILRLAWDPELDTDALIREYCDKAYGKAGREVYRYLEHGSKIREGMGAYFKGGSRGFLQVAHVAFDEQTLRDLEAIAEKAALASAGDEEQYRKRTEVFLKAVKYMGLQARALALLNREDKTAEDYNRLVKLVQERESFVENLGPTWAIFAPAIRERVVVSKMAPLVGYQYYEHFKTRKISVSLPDKWAFYIDQSDAGEKLGLNSPAYDDAHLLKISINSTWEEQGLDYNGLAWYRCAFAAPPKAEAKKYYFWLGAADESYWIYLNGEKVGENLFDAETNQNSWCTPFSVDITGGLKFGETNLIAVKVRDIAGAGGIYKGAFILEDLK